MTNKTIALVPINMLSDDQMMQFKMALKKYLNQRGQTIDFICCEERELLKYKYEMIVKVCPPMEGYSGRYDFAKTNEREVFVELVGLPPGSGIARLGFLVNCRYGAVLESGGQTIRCFSNILEKYKALLSKPQAVQEDLHSLQQREFNTLLYKLSELIDEEAQDQSPSDYVILQQARILRNKLGAAGKLYLDDTNRDLKSLSTFKNTCNSAISEFKRHGGLWYQIHPLIRGILGVLAAFLVIPGLTVQAFNNKGFIQTFFSTPKILLQENLSEIQLLTRYF